MKQKLLIVAILAFVIVCVVADPFTFSDTRPLPGDLKIVRLQKWYQRLGGTPDNRDDEQTLLEKIVPIAGSGGTGIADGDKGDVVVSGSGTIWSLDTSGVTAGTYGSASYIPQIVLDSKGRVTSITTNAVSGGGGGSAPVGTVINTVASTAGQIAVFSDTTKTNVVPSSGVTNLTLSTPTVDAGVFTTSARLPNGASVTTASVGMIGFDNDVLASGHGAFQFTDGTLTELLLGIDAASTFTDGFVPTWVAASKKFTLQAGGSGGSISGLTSGVIPVATGSTSIGNGPISVSAVTNTATTGNGTYNALTATNGFTSGNGSTAGSIDMFDGGTHYFSIRPPTMSTSANLIPDTAPGGGFWFGTVSATTNETITHIGSSGSGNVARVTSPTFVTPTLGAATLTSANKMAITAPATSSTLAVADGKTFTVNNTVTIAATDSTTITLPAATATVLSSAGGEINAYTSKGTPIGADLAVIEDSAASNAKKKVTLGSLFQIATNSITFALSDMTTALTTGTNKNYWMPKLACTVKYVRANVSTVSSSGLPTFDILKNGTSILSTAITIDANERSSDTAATAAVISTSAVAASDYVNFSITTAGTGATGAQVEIGYTIP